MSSQRWLSYVPAQSLASDGLTSIEVTTADGIVASGVRRSYPKGKPEKLMDGLRKLLSAYDTDTNSGVSSSTPNSHPWTLSHNGDAIHRVLTISGQPQLDAMLQAVEQESTKLAHHPHIASKGLGDPKSEHRICVITCTTHVPYGLSLKDVRLAEQVNSIIDQLNESHPASISSTDDETARSIGIDLITGNETAAAAARNNPDTICRTEHRKSS